VVGLFRASHSESYFVAPVVSLRCLPGEQFAFILFAGENDKAKGTTSY